MKTSLCWLLLASFCVAVCHTKAVQKQAPDALSHVDEKEVAVEAKEDLDDLSEDERIKRSGGKIAGYVGNRIRSGISSGVSLGISSIASASSFKPIGKLGLLPKGDVHARTFGGGNDHHGYEEVHDEHHISEGKKADIWTFKKSIVSTLLQAVKALTGGVIGLSGKVTGGVGHVVEAKGRLLQTAGESLYGFGRHVSQKALAPVVLPHHHVPHVSHYEHAPIGYGGSGHGGLGHGLSGHGGGSLATPLFSSYGGPSGISSEYGAPHYHVARAAKPAPAAHHKSDVKAGLLVLKPINVPNSVSADYPRQSNNLNHAPSDAYDSYAPPPPAPKRLRSSKLSQAEPPADYADYVAPRTVYKQQPSQVKQPAEYGDYVAPRMIYKQQLSQAPSTTYQAYAHAPSMNYHTYAQAPRTVARSYSVQYQPSLGYQLPSIEYEY